MSARIRNRTLAGLVRLASCWLLFACVQPVVAQTIDYDPLRAPELRACDDDLYRGRREPATQCYSRVLVSSDNVATQAEAAWAMGDMQRANTLFRDALKANERAVQPRVRWGRLFLETHQYNDALALFNEALMLDPNDAQAKLAIATVFAERFEGQARTLLEEVLQQDAKLIEPHLLAARMALEENQPEDVERSLRRATDLAEDRKLPLLDIYTLRAALDRTKRDDASNRWVERALAYNPRYGGVYAELAHFEIMRRRYQQGAELLRKAVEVQPDLWSAHAELGANLLRLGDVEGARQHLTTAYSGDPYSPTTVNTLRLLDRFGEFDVLTSSVTLTHSNTPVEVRLRLHRREAAALQPYVLDVARRSIDTFTQRYGFQLQKPVTVELYPDHDDFAVRVAALPGIGLLGVTFGYLVAMDSPSGRATGEFHWGSTLWHEMAHVFTLEATDHRVPRWLSEGLSVFEEWRTGPTPGVSVPPDVIAALRDGKLLPVSDLDAGFIRPTYPNQVQVSYMQAGLVCLFIEQHWGFERLVALLKQFTRETTSAAAIEATFKIAPTEFDKQFDAFARQRYQGILAGMEEWEKLYQSARAAIEAEKWQEALEPARQAAELYPEHVGPGSPRLLLAKALLKLDRRDEAIVEIDRYRRAGGWDPAVLRELAALLDKTGRDAEAIEVLNALNLADPLNPEQHITLGDHLLAANAPDAALREFKVLLALNPHDMAGANFGAARALRALGDKPASRRYLLDALATAPHYKPAQELLLTIVEERSRNE